MSTPFNAAASAYGNVARLVGDAARTAAKPEAAAGQGDDFAKLLANSVQGVLDQGQAANTAAMDLVNGKGDIVNVVTAISQTEMAIDTMVAVRDKVISAYEEIMRMPI